MPSSLVNITDMESRIGTGCLQNGTSVGTASGNTAINDEPIPLTMDLSMLGFSSDDEVANEPNSKTPPLDVNGINDARSVRRSCNTTECVPVPSSEHVAEIVGRQGKN